MKDTTRRIIAAGRRRKLMMTMRKCIAERNAFHRRQLAEQLRGYGHAERREIYRDG